VPASVVLPSALRAAGGRLWWSTGDCSAGWLAVGLGRTHTLAGRYCHVWPARNGFNVVLADDSRVDDLDGGGLRIVAPGGREAPLAHTPGLITGDLAWSPDGAVVGACVSTRTGRPVLDLLYPYSRREIPGACQPAWTGAGHLVTTRPWPPRLVVAGRVVLSPKEAAALLPGTSVLARRVVNAVAAAGNRIAVGLTEFNPQPSILFTSMLVVLSSDGKVVFRRRLGPHVPETVGLAPDGTAVWYTNAGDGTARLLRIRDGRRVSLIMAHRYTWSPDGRYLAAATDSGVLVSTWPGGRYVTAIPIAARDLSWSGGA